jgi:glycosyltransferase involved in cell wall biosynthesis
MRILFQYLTGGGGALSNVILLLKALSKKYPQDHIDVICSKSSGLHILEDLPNVKVLSYGTGWNQEVDRLLLGFGGLKRIAKERRADIIWSLNLGPYMKTDVPQVLSVHNPHQVYPWHVTRTHPDSRLNVAGLRWFFRKSLRVSDGVIVQTPIMGEYVREISGAPNRIAVAAKSVENPEDVVSEPLPYKITNVFESGLGSQTFTFLYVATYTPHKNHIALVEAFDMLASGGYQVRVLLTVGRDELLQLGGERARALIDSGHIVPLGWTKKEYLKSLYDICDACLMPSMLESLSSAHLEAMQWGKPQITSDLPYALDLCGEAALYVSANDPSAWAERIKMLIADQDLRARLVAAGYERMKCFPATWAEASTIVHQFLEELVVQKKSNNI